MRSGSSSDKGRSKFVIMFLTTTIYFGNVTCQYGIVPYSNFGSSSLGSSNNLLTGYQLGVIQLPTTPPSSTTSFKPGPAWMNDPLDMLPGGRNPCRSTTKETFLDCPCSLIGTACRSKNSTCTKDPNGDGFCSCNQGYFPMNGRCVNQTELQQIMSLMSITSPGLVVSCFLPINGVLGNIPHLGGKPPLDYALTLLVSSPLGSTKSFIGIDNNNGNILSKALAPATVQSQTYQVLVKSRANPFEKPVALIFKVAYNCTPPVCSVDTGSPIYVECQLQKVGSTIGTIIAAGSVAPTRYSMTLVSSTSTLAKEYYRVDPFTGFVEIQKQPHGGIFIEVYNVTAVNGVGQSCSVIQLKIISSSDCT